MDFIFIINTSCKNCQKKKTAFKKLTSQSHLLYCKKKCGGVEVGLPRMQQLKERKYLFSFLFLCNLKILIVSQNCVT